MSHDNLTHGKGVAANHSLTQHQWSHVHNWAPDENAILFLVLALILGYLIGRSRASRATSFQNRGEALLSWKLLANFSSPDYHLMNHVTLKMSNGTTQIDHILVSKYGVFVIETKDYKGWIFA